VRAFNGNYLKYGIGVCPSSCQVKRSNESEKSTVIKQFEELSLNAWPALQTQLYDGWILRFANGYTKRSNSINPLYESSLPLGEKIDICENKYQNQNLATIFKLTAESNPTGIDQLLEIRGYQRLDETSVRILAMAQYQYRKLKGILIEDSFSDPWFKDFVICSGLANGILQRTAQDILHHIQGEVIVVRKSMNDQIVGCGFGAIERGHIGIFDIIVAKSHRGKGYGRDIMDGILSAAMDKKIENAYLSVVVGNIPAETLYQKIGFQEIYRYWYHQKASI
jgi:N-acetylglutamate synthase